jgi:hypothetical protein
MHSGFLTFILTLKVKEEGEKEKINSKRREIAKEEK